jgi:hypothetical protein
MSTELMEPCSHRYTILGVKISPPRFPRTLLLAILLAISLREAANAQRRELAANCNLHRRVSAKFPDGSMVPPPEDDAIAATVDWVAKNPKEGWQVIVITPDEQGLWSADGLRPGSCDVLVRGIVSRLDAAWFFSYDVEPGRKTHSLEAQPRFFRPIKRGPGSTPHGQNCTKTGKSRIFTFPVSAA